MTPKYRPDIDGLRAVAVLCVIFYHTGFSVFSGGYVGVDIFFVISGFLITTIIVREIGAQNFSIAMFYERRMRRILPAIMTVVVFCLVAGYFLLEAGDYRDLAFSSIANNIFLSNMYFNFQAGYFDGPAELKPLLHTWSLSVEEQYYLLFPLLLLLIAKFFNKKYLYFLIPVLVASFVACVVGMNVDATAVFYMLPTRAWELCIGSILAIAAIPPLRHAVGRNAVALIGLALIVYSNFLFDDETVFPGSSAAVPTIGAALVIYTGASGSTLVSRLLSIRPVVFVGMISYSLYLWHWPLIVFAKYYKAVDLSRKEELLLLAVMFVASVLSWRFVETPFRKKQLLATRKSMFIASFVATALLIGAGMYIVTGGGDSEWRQWRACEDAVEDPDDWGPPCTLGAAGSEPSFMLWGDSHARSLASSVEVSASRNGVAGVIATHSACPALENLTTPRRPECIGQNVAVLDFLSQQSEIKTVILAGRWVFYLEGTRYKDEEGDPTELVDRSISGSDERSRREVFEAGMRGTISTLQEMGKRVVVVGPVPEVGYEVPAKNHIAQITSQDVNAMIAPRLDEFLTRNSAVLEILEMIESKNVVVVRPAQILCNDDYCEVALDDGTALYRDDHHLSTFGAKHVSGIFDSVFSNDP